MDLLIQPANDNISLSIKLLLKHQELSVGHIYEAGWCAHVTRGGLGVLRRMLKERSLVVMELDQWDVDVRSSSGLDGCPLFLSRTAWKDIMSPHPLWWK